MKIEIITANDRVLNISITDNDLIDHFNNPDNCTAIILNQINNEKIYKSIFEGKENLVILDIGANIGLFSAYASGFAKNIYSVEATPSHFTKLNKLTESLSDVIKAVNYAVSDKDGTIDFYVSSKNPTQNSLIRNWRSTDEQKITIETRTLDSLLKEFNLDYVDLIKCDIEGSEMIALNKNTVGLVKNKVKSWYIELHQTDNTIEHNDSIKQNMKILTEVFTECDYTVEPIGFDNLRCYKE
jgi:FkbM family methyltransferase